MFKKIIFCLDWFFTGALTAATIAELSAANYGWATACGALALLNLGSAWLAWDDVFKNK